jgi:hypothetical protein
VENRTSQMTIAMNRNTYLTSRLVNMQMHLECLTQQVTGNCASGYVSVSALVLRDTTKSKETEMMFDKIN